MAQDKPEPFPSLTPVQSEANALGTPETAQNRTPPNASGAPTPARRTRGSSLRESFMNSNPPLGMWQATGEVGSKIPTLPEIKNGAFSAEGWSHEGQMEKRGANPHEIHRRRVARTSSASTRTRKSSITAASPITPSIAEEAQQFFPRRGSVSMKEAVVEESTVRVEEQQPDIVSQDKEMPEKIQEMSASSSDAEAARTNTGPDETGTYPNGYRFPRKHNWTQSTVIGMKAFWKFTLTPFGFLITLYGLNVVGWGAMIFFVLLNAAPAMCHPTCNAENSSRKIWIEIDSQVLNGLFCVTGFGLIPWRFRDFYYLIRWRVFKDYSAHRTLAGLYRGWYRLPGHESLPEDIGPPPKYSKKQPVTDESPPPFTPEEIARLEQNTAVPLPATSMPEPPLTGVRAQPSRSWSLDFVIWMYMWNTILQCFLAGFMWGYNRHNRPSWAVGLFITLGCLTGIFAGVLVFIEGSKVKKAEGIPIQEYDVLESIEDFQERKGKEEAKEAKKHEKEEKHHQREVIRSEKMKGHQWFTRH